MALTFALAWSIPLAIYILLGDYGDDGSGVVYWIVVIAIALTALFIWVEGFLSLRRADPPRADHYPPASAIIAACLPNEAATLESTIESFLSQDYPGDLQVILAYTPHDMPFGGPGRPRPPRPALHVAARARKHVQGAERQCRTCHREGRVHRGLRR